MNIAVVSGRFDNLRSTDVRMLEEASKFGTLHAFIWSDELIRRFDLHSPKFPLEERKYLLQGIRFISEIHSLDQIFEPDMLVNAFPGDSVTWVLNANNINPQKQMYCASHNIQYQAINESSLHSFPDLQNLVVENTSLSKKVIVTGSFDWLHSGHFRFFEEASELGDLYVVVGSDKNICLLKGEGHPLFPQAERRYMVSAVRYVKQAFISSGSGWMDAEPEIEFIKPDIYVVNEDGDRPIKRTFCEEHNIEYVVLKRIPKMGLPKRESTMLRGF
jgi:cytidyltransferase-like protein